MMLRHALDPLFQPRSLLVVSDRVLPLFQALPSGLRVRTTRVSFEMGQTPTVPDKLAGVAANERVDLVVISVPPLMIESTLAAVAPHRPCAIIVMAHGVVDPDPARTRGLCNTWAQDNQCALLGPFSFGLQRPHLGLNLSQHPLLARAGRAALVAQSRTVMAGVMDWADDVHIGFSTTIALGNEGITRLPAVLDYLAGDPRTDSIAIYLEDIGSGREFMSAIRAAASIKPVVVLRSGAANEPLLADLAFDAALRRAGVVRVTYFIQLFSAIKVFGYSRRPAGRRVAVFANGEGPAQLALDLAVEGGPIEKAVLGPLTRRRLGELLEPGALALNPVVTHQPLTASLLNDIMSALIADDEVDGVLVMLAPDRRTDFKAVAAALAQLAPKAAKPVVSCFMGDADMRSIRRVLDEAGASAFRTPESAANAFGILARYHYNQQLLLQIQPAEPDHKKPDLEQARRLLKQWQAAGKTQLDAPEAWALLATFHVPLQPMDPNASPGDEPLSVLEVPSSISVTRDARFGPVIRFGAGGVLGVFSPDQAGADLVPLNYFLANRMVQRSQFCQKLPREHFSTVVFKQLLMALELISDLVSECPAVLALRLDPIVIRHDRLKVAGLSMTLDPTSAIDDPSLEGYPHMAIHPYPRQWVQRLPLSDGQEGVLRPIRPDDAQALQDFTRLLSEQARYMRFVSMMRELTPRMLARYTQVDYHRELALVATIGTGGDASQDSPETIIGLAHYLRNPDGRGAEYALVIADAWQARGLGRCLMTCLIEAARQQGLAYIEGLVLANNRPMLSLMTGLGMVNDPDPDDPGMRRVWLDLGLAGR
jgi:acetyltransferase